MSLSEYLEGAAFFALVFGGTGVAAALATRRARLPAGSPRVLGFAVLWLCALFAAHVLPGVTGQLGRTEVAVTALVIAGAALVALRAVPAGGDPGPAFPRAAADSGIRSWLFALVLGGGTTVAITYLFFADARTAVDHVDVVSFHLPNVARWIQDATMWQIDDFIPDRSPGNYPGTSDVFSLTTMLPWRDDFLVRFVNLPLLAIAGAGCYALARELRAPAATAAIVASAFVALPVTSWVAFVGLADTAMLATFAAGCYFLLRHARTGAGWDFALAGLALGLSLGTRWYAVFAVAAVIGIWAGAGLVARIGVVRVARETSVLSALVLLAGGVWLLRNLVLSDNPVFPVKVEVGGAVLFDAPPDAYRELLGSSIADYFFELDVWRDFFWDGFLAAMSWGAVVLWAGLAIGAVIALLRLRARSDDRGDSARILALCAAAAVIGIAFIFTPYTAAGPEGEPAFGFVNSRYVLPALILGVAVLARALTWAGQWRQGLELVVVAAGFDGLRRTLDLPTPDITARKLAALLAALALAAAAAALIAWLVRSRRRVALAVAVVALAAIVTAVGRNQQVKFDEGRYVGGEPVIESFRTTLPPGSRVGIVGEGWGSYPYFGPGFVNEVEYIGPRVEGTLRPHRDERSFDAAVARGDYDVVVVQDLYELDKALPQRQERWLKDDGYRLVGSGVQRYAFNAAVRVYVPPAS